jgi:hypothetical protein
VRVQSKKLKQDENLLASSIVCSEDKSGLKEFVFLGLGEITVCRTAGRRASEDSFPFNKCFIWSAGKKPGSVDAAPGAEAGSDEELLPKCRRAVGAVATLVHDGVNLR